MKKKRWMKRIASAVLTAAMVVSQIGVWNAGWGQEVVKAEEKNYITNGDFSTNAEGWTLTTDLNETKNESLTCGQNAAGGANAAYISNSTGSDCDAYFTQKIGSLSAGTYILTAYSMGNGYSGMQAVVENAKVDGTWVNSVAYNTDKANWAKLEYTFTVSEDKTDFVVGLYLWTYTGGTYTYLDDVSLVKANEQKIAYNELKSTISSCDSLVEGDYTAESWSELQAALNTANAITDTSELSAIQAAQTGLTAAISGLEALVIEVYKRDFNGDNETLSEWTSNLETTSTSKNEIDASQWKLWSTDAKEVTLSTTVDSLTAGNYYLSLVAKGGSMNTDNCKVSLSSLSDESVKIEKNTVINEWDKSNPTTTNLITLSKADSITIKMVFDMQADGWCNLDDIVLYKKVTLEEKKAYELEELKSLIAACNTLNAANYSASTWTVFSSALVAAKNVAEASDLTLDAISTATKNLKSAKAALKEAGIYVKKVEGLSNDFIRGVDISSYVSIKDSGATFKDESGKVLSDAEFFQLLKDSGVNYVRVRIWNDPYTASKNGYGGGNSDLDKAKTIGKLAADAGMKTLVDFHYSDFWADPERQYSPKTWRNYTENGDYTQCTDGKYTEKSVEEKETLLYNFTYNSLTALIAAGVDVGMVQVGNETNNGIAGVDATGDWADVCKLYKKGSEAVRAVAKKESKDILVALHFTDPQTIGNYDKFAGKLAAQGVDYDVFASSYYPNIHGSMENLTNVLSKVADIYGKKVMVAETAWAWTTKDGDGTDNGVNPGTNPDYSNTVQGQAKEIRDVVQAVVNVPDKAGIGVFYWEPAWIPVQYAYDENGNLNSSIKASNEDKHKTYGSGWASVYSGEYDPEHGGKYAGGSVKDADAFFDFEGNPLSSLTIFKDIYEGRTGAGVEIDIIKDAEIEVLLQTSNVASALDTIKAALPASVIGINNDSTRVPLSVTWDITKVEAIDDFGSYPISGIVSYKDKEGNDKNASVSCELNVLPKSIVQNGDFEAGEASWNIEKGKDYINNWNETPHRGDGSMHFYSAKTLDIILTQTVIAKDSGVYRASLEVQGGDASSSDIRIKITNNRTGDSKEGIGSLQGWKNWQKVVAEGLNVNVGDEIKVIITVNAEPGEKGPWGSIDDVFLYKVGDLENNNGGGSDSGSNSGSTPTTPTPSPETKPDGSTVETTTETKPDGTKVETTTETATDGSKKETVVETKQDGTKVETITETATDGSKVETKKESETNTAGKQVEVSTVTKTDADGKVASVVEKSTISEVAKNTTATVTVKKDGEGAVTSATASVAATIEGKKTSLSADVIAQVQEASGQKDVAVTVTAKNDEGKTLYKVKVDTKDLTADNALYIYKVDSKTGELVMVNSKTYKVDENGGLDISIKNKATYELVSKAEAKAIEKQIKATVKVQNSSKDVKKGKTTKVAFDKKMNMNNVKSITYQTADKKIATVSKSGKVTAKAKGTVTVKATVTLKNGSKKTVTMKIKVK